MQMNNKEYGVKLNLDISKFTKNLEKAKEMANKAKNNIEEPLRKVKITEDGKERKITIKSNAKEVAKDFKELESAKKRIESGQIKIFKSDISELADVKPGMDALGNIGAYKVDPKLMGYQFSLNELKESAKEATPEIDNVDKSMKELGDETENTKNKGQGISITFARFGDSVSKSVSKGVNNLKRFALSLFGIRSIYSMLSRAVHAYMSTDESLSNKIQANWIALGAVFAPIVEKLIALFQRLIGYVNVFYKALTGKSLISVAMKKYEGSTKKATKATKELNKELANFDEITNLNFDSGSGIGDSGDEGSGVPDIGDYLKDLENMQLNPKIVEIVENFAKTLKKAWKWIKKNKDMLLLLGETVAIVFAGFKIGKTIGKLAEMFNLVEKGSSASGAFGLWGLAIAGIIADLKLAWELGKKIADLIDAQNEKKEAELRLNDQNLKTMDIALGILQDSEASEQRKSDAIDAAEQTYREYYRRLKEGAAVTKEQKDAMEQQVKAIEKVSGKTFKTKIEAEVDAELKKESEEKLKNTISTIFSGTSIFSGIKGFIKGVGGGAGTGFAKGNVAYQPTVAEFGEYAGARSNPEITAPQNIIRETLYDALTDALPLLGNSGTGGGDVILNINGKELARATYSDFKAEGNRIGSSNVAVRRR